MANPAGEAENGLDPEAYLADVIDRMAKGLPSTGSMSYCRGIGSSAGSNWRHDRFLQ